MIILNKDTNPEREIYYLGAIVIETIMSVPKNEIDFFDVFQLMNKKKRISINLFVLTLDWLYLTGIIKYNKGAIIKCF